MQSMAQYGTASNTRDVSYLASSYYISITSITGAHTAKQVRQQHYINPREHYAFESEYSFGSIMSYYYYSLGGIM